MKRWILLFTVLLGLLAAGLPVGAAPAIEAIYAVNPGDYTYHPVPAGDFAKIQKALDLPAAEGRVGNEKILGGFCVFEKGGKRLYTVTGTRVLLDGKPLNATDVQRVALLKHIRGYWAAGTGIPELLAYMSPEKITSVSFNGMAHDVDEKYEPLWIDLKIRTADAPELVEQYAKILKSLTVMAQNTKVTTRGPINTSTEPMDAKITFDTGVTYSMTLWDKTCLIGSSDAAVPGRVYYYQFTDNMAHPRGWYLRDEMEDLYNQCALYQEAVFLTFAGDEARITRVTDENSPGREILCQLGAFASRFRDAAVSDKSPPRGPMKSTENNWIGIYLKPRGKVAYQEIWLWSDQRGGRWLDEKDYGFHNWLLPGDCAYIKALAQTGTPLTPPEALRYLPLPV